MVVNGFFVPAVIVRFAEIEATKRAKSDGGLTSGELVRAIVLAAGMDSEKFASRLADRTLTNLKRKGRIEFDGSEKTWRAKS